MKRLSLWGVLILILLLHSVSAWGYFSEEKDLKTKAYQFFLIGKHFYEEGKYEKATAFLRKAISLWPEDGTIKIIEEKTITRQECKFLPSGRTVRRVCNNIPEKKEVVKKREYYPNMLLTQISKKFQYISPVPSPVYQKREKFSVKETIINRAECVEAYPNRYLFASVVYDYDELSDLNYVKNDVELIKNLAICYLGIPRENMKILVNPSLGRLKKELRDFTKRITKKDSLLYFYYSGHGVMDSEGKFYLLPRDASIEDEQILKETAISIEDLKWMFHRAKGYKIAFIDACRVNPRWKPAVLMYKPKVVDTAFIFSTTQGEISNADREGKHSAFTRALYGMARAGLKNVDLDASGYIEIKEIITPLKNWLREVSSSEQIPEVWGKTNLPVFPVE